MCYVTKLCYENFLQFKKCKIQGFCPKRNEEVISETKFLHTYNLGHLREGVKTRIPNFFVTIMSKSAIVVFKMIKFYLIYAVLNQILLPICPKFLKEGGGPKAQQIVLIFFVPIRGGGWGSMNLGQNPQILLFFLRRPLEN